MNTRDHQGYVNFLMITCFLVMVNAMVLPEKQLPVDGRKYRSGDIDNFSKEEIPRDSLLVDINRDDLKHLYTLQQFEDPDNGVVVDTDVVKRFLGRWRDRNWKLSQRQHKTFDLPPGKRFFGRWMNRNYILSKLQSERENRSRLDAQRKLKNA